MSSTLASPRVCYNRYPLKAGGKFPIPPMYDFLDGVASTEPSTWGVSPDIARAIWARYEGEGKNYLEHESALQFLEEVLTTIQPIQADEGMVPRPKSGDWGEWETNKSCRGTFKDSLKFYQWYIFSVAKYLH